MISPSSPPISPYSSSPSPSSPFSPSLSLDEPCESSSPSPTSPLPFDTAMATAAGSHGIILPPIAIPAPSPFIPSGRVMSFATGKRIKRKLPSQPTPTADSAPNSAAVSASSGSIVSDLEPSALAGAAQLRAVIVSGSDLEALLFEEFSSASDPASSSSSAPPKGRIAELTPPLPSSRAHLCHLPAALQIFLFSFLDPSSLCFLTRVCRHLRAPSQDWLLWSALYSARWEPSRARTKLDWKALYRIRHVEEMEEDIGPSVDATIAKYFRQMTKAAHFTRLLWNSNSGVSASSSSSAASGSGGAAAAASADGDAFVNQFSVIREWSRRNGQQAHWTPSSAQHFDCGKQRCTYFGAGNLFICEGSGLVHFCGRDCEYLRNGNWRREREEKRRERERQDCDAPAHAKRLRATTSAAAAAADTSHSAARVLCCPVSGRSSDSCQYVFSEDGVEDEVDSDREEDDYGKGFFGRAFLAGYDQAGAGNFDEHKIRMRFG